MAKIKYWIPGKFIPRNSAIEFESRETDPQALAEEVAEDYCYNHDGWESRWPLDITLELADGTVKTFSIEQEMVPHFEATEVQQPFKDIHCKTHADFQYECIDCSDALTAARGW